MGTAPLDTDVPAGGAATVYPSITPPGSVGRYVLRIDLVQRGAQGLDPLPVTPVQTSIEVVYARAAGDMSRHPARK